MKVIFEHIKNYFIHSGLKWVIGIIAFIVGFFLIKIVSKALAKVFEKTDFDPTVEVFIQRSIKVFLWIVLIIFILGNLGINVTGILAGLGIVGFIVGFAVKDVLANLASGIFILMNRPFKVGEKVEVAGIKGIVEEINIYACIIITEDKKYVTIPNSKIWSGPIKNLTRLKTYK